MKSIQGKGQASARGSRVNMLLGIYSFKNLYLGCLFLLSTLRMKLYLGLEMHTQSIF